MLRTGPFGDGFGAEPAGLTLAKLEAESARHRSRGAGSRIASPISSARRRARSKRSPSRMRDDLDRLADSLDRDWDASMVLVGRRHVRSNNSWMHNVHVLTKGRNRLHAAGPPRRRRSPRARRRRPGPGRAHGSARSALDVEVTDGIRPGVVSIPHGFGQNLPGVPLRVAQEYRGVNTNVLTDEQFYDPVSGNIALNGVPVTVERA